MVLHLAAIITSCVSITSCGVTKGIDALEASDFFTTNTRESHGKVMEIKKQPSRLDLRQFSFSHREEDDWNYLPSKTVEARYVEQFNAFYVIRFLHTAL